MNTIKIKILSAAILSTLAFSTLAQETSTEAPVTTLGSIDSIDAKIAYEQKQLALEQAQLQRKLTQEELNESKFIKLMEQRELDLLSKFSKRESELLGQIETLQKQIHNLESINKNEKKVAESSIEGVASKVYVTSIAGVGSNLTATVYFNEMVTKVNAGAALSESIVVEKVHPNGVTVSNGGQFKFIALTNEKFAFSKTFNKDAAEMLQGQTRSPLSLRGN